MKSIALRPNKVLLILLSLVLIQFVVYMIVAHLKPGSMYKEGLWDIFNVDVEMSIFTWYSQILFLLPAIIMTWLAFSSESTKNKVYWGLLSGLMVYLSADDGAMIHERFSIINNYFGLVEAEGVFHYSWTGVAIILVLVVCAVFAKFFFSLPSRTRLLLVLSGLLFLSGALGVEMYTSYMADNGIGVKPIIIALEETLEVAGVSVLTYALLDHIRRLPKGSRSVVIEVID